MYIEISCNIHKIPDSLSRVIKKFYDLLGRPSYMTEKTRSSDWDAIGYFWVKWTVADKLQSIYLAKFPTLLVELSKIIQNQQAAE